MTSRAWAWRGSRCTPGPDGAASENPGEKEIRGVAGLETAGPDEITFLANSKYAPKVRETRAGAIIVNAGALSHTSWSLHDALAAFDGVVVELHLSNPAAREPFRHTSTIAPVADGCIAGFGGLGYPLAVEAVSRILAGRP